MQQRVADLQSIGSALQNGDLAGAQQAYTALASISSFTNPSGPLAQNFAALGQALQNGDVAGAQQALSNIGNGAVKNIEAQIAQNGGNATLNTFLSELETIPGVTGGPSSSPGASSSNSSSLSPLNVLA
jgi:hypothetical protein